MKETTVSIFAHGLNGGGAERVASILANELNRRGYNTYFVAVFSPQKEYILDPKVKYKYIGKFNKFGIISRFLRKVLVYNHMVKTKSTASISFVIGDQDIAFRSKKYKKIVSLRNDPSHMMKSPYLKKVIPKVFINSDYVVFQTEDARSFFAEEIQEKGVVIFNPITSNLPYWKDYKHEKIVMTACRLDAQKNLPLLIYSFSDFISNHPDYRLNIFGEGPLKEDLEKLIKQLSLEKKVFLMGRTKEIFKEYCKSEMFVLSSDYEGMSNSMIEALAIGIPTICTDCPIGGAKALIQDGENGILTKVGDRNELVNAMNLIADSKELKILFSQKADIIREKLSVQTIINQWENLL